MKLTVEEESYLPCNPIIAVAEVKRRLNCSLREARDLVYSHPKYKPLEELYSDICPKCGNPNSILCHGNNCTECGEHL